MNISCLKFCSKNSAKVFGTYFMILAANYDQKVSPTDTSSRDPAPPCAHFLDFTWLYLDFTTIKQDFT